MKKVWFVIGIVAIAWGCSPKAKPGASPQTPVATATPDPSPAPPPVPPAAPVAGKFDMATIENGQKIYETRCGRCHGLKNTALYTASSWTGIMDRMAPKARLDEKEKAQTLAYVQHHAKDGPKNKENM